MDAFPLVCIFLLVVLVVAIVVGSTRHVRSADFKPTFVKLSDGSLQMEFYHFGGLQTKRTERFYDQYKVGMRIVHEGAEYTIAQLKEVADASLVRPDKKIVAYLEEASYGKR